ncbi:DUF2169 domain-containing protein [Polyangium sp. 6x1]|uniref:DUF2169 family type VI secretion system accessory protein n=1 Tax=Polyangium sp. 6x1 TaxID=3042689 RepID=UPI002482BE20|nr:DUF2169 domain-containing protein [Polyangium sp. 6x1]MDI1445990.1 DUF2169 domain-containing protein [Polyangium sp. 6x1]
MRVVKPQRLSVFQRVFTLRGEHHLSVGICAYFPLEAPEVPLPEDAMWQRVTPELGKGAAGAEPILDEGMPKPRGEILVYGTAFAPGGKASPAFAARLKLGPAEKPILDKTVYAVGKRVWKNGVPSDPEPITEMIIAWENAFGGPSYPQNPRGMGLSPVEEEGRSVHYLPHLEDPRHMITSPRERPPPASFGALDPTLEERRAKLGTYGSEWLEKDFPGFARDIDPEAFQVAPADQRIAAYFQGGEAIALENFHPKRSRIESHVPLLHARVFVSNAETAEGVAAEGALREVVTRLETVLLFPNLERGVAIFRGVIKVAEDDAGDVAVLLAGLERADAPKPALHYREVLIKRLDEEKGLVEALRERDLLPELPPNAPLFDEELSGDMDDLLEDDELLEKRASLRAERDLARAREDLRAAGLDPEEALPNRPGAAAPIPEGDDLADYIQGLDAEADLLEKDLDTRSRDAEEKARRNCSAQGIDFDALREKSQREGGGPPKFRADTEIAQMREIAATSRKAGAPIPDLEARIADPRFVADLREIEASSLEAYRAHAHLFPPAEALSDAEKAKLRAEVEAALGAGESLARRDLTGADLHGLRLAEADLREALLEGADLSDCDLSSADLSGAVLARAILKGARFEDTKLVGANLGFAEASGVRFAGAHLRDAILYKTRLDGAQLAGAELTGAEFFETRVMGADFTDADARKVQFYQLDLTEARFTGAQLGEATFLQCKGAGANFDGATLVETSFLDFSGEKASFREAQARGLTVIADSALPGADFSAADLEEANLSGVNLEGATFEGARAEGADFSEAVLRGARLASLGAREARFARADLSEADLRGANLMEAVLDKAKVPGAIFEKANLFGASLLHTIGDDRTSFAGALVKQVAFTRHEG